ncbi:hypothetical protein B296_00021602 [Ensete ventricosum]|uniref:Uncharacterized protein n=1 Tax=Ensete ventricosum TaxID=4639 RepID=A0A426ZYE1_ENSVE|nr:hypothetical protein B296_00021602 [Ensete ventricosum]
MLRSFFCCLVKGMRGFEERVAEKVWVVEFYQILNANVGGSGRLIDLRLGVDVGGDILKHLWELLGWMEVVEMAVGAAGMRL